MLAKPMEKPLYVVQGGKLCAGDLTARDRVGLPQSVEFSHHVTRAANLLRRAASLQYGSVDSEGKYHLDARRTMRERKPLYERAIEILASLGEEGERRIELDEREGKIVLNLDGERLGEFDFQLPHVIRVSRAVNPLLYFFPNYPA